MEKKVKVVAKKSSGVKPAAKKVKAQAGKSVKPTADSTAYFRKQRDMEYADADKAFARSEKDKSPYSSRLYGDYIKSRGVAAKKAQKNVDRQFFKGKSGYDENGFPIYKNKFKSESPKEQIDKGLKKKVAVVSMKAGGTATKSKVNEAGNYTKPSMRKSLFNRIKAGGKGGNPGQWSARKAQLLASQYKKNGGGYTN